MKIEDLPLWRLLVALDDAERVTGADSPTSRTLARAVQERLRDQPSEHYERRPVDNEGGADAS
jgi:hypothetical protein